MSNLGNPLEHDDGKSENLIFAERIRLVYQSTYFGVAIQAIVVSTLCLAQYEYASTIQTIGLLVYFLFSIIFRLAINYRFNKVQPEPQQTHKWATLYTISMLIAGLGWIAASYIYIASSDSVSIIFTALVLGGISTGGLVSLAGHLPAYYALLFPAMGSGIVGYAQIGTDISYYTAGLGALLLTFLFVSAKKLNTILISNISLKIKYEFLLKDLAEEKKTTDQLNDSLSVEIKERRLAEAQSIKAMVEAEKANMAKTEFLSSMSHELRTPLNAIMGFGQLLEFGIKEPKQAKYISEILAGGRYLLSLVNQVLDLAKIEIGKVDIKISVESPEPIIANALSMIQNSAQTDGISVNFQSPPQSLPRIMVDQTRVLQTLLNLLSNAIKYNKPNGKITISAEKVDSSFIRISVTDTGVGIPAQSHQDLFEPFNRLSHQTSKIEGTGIGLSISKSLIELMNGKIDFHSKVDEGSTFWIDLPIAPKDAMTLVQNGKVSIAD